MIGKHNNRASKGLCRWRNSSGDSPRQTKSTLQHRALLSQFLSSLLTTSSHPRACCVFITHSIRLLQQCSPCSVGSKTHEAYLNPTFPTASDRKHTRKAHHRRHVWRLFPWELEGQSQWRGQGLEHTRPRRARPATVARTEHTAQWRQEVCSRDRAGLHREQRPVQRCFGSHIPGRSVVKTDEQVNADVHSLRPSSKRRRPVADPSTTTHAPETPHGHISSDTSLRS
jgi:hypothetical protein